MPRRREDLPPGRRRGAPPCAASISTSSPATSPPCPGPSGSGKTTLLSLIGGLDRPTGGEISVDGEPISGMSKARLADLRPAQGSASSSRATA
jgi:hypothetical protein